MVGIFIFAAKAKRERTAEYFAIKRTSNCVPSEAAYFMRAIRSDSAIRHAFDISAGAQCFKPFNYLFDV